MFAELAKDARATAAATPELTAKRPVTLGVGEPFTATFKVAAWAALLLAMPLLLYQAYAFVLPAFSPREREVAVPLMLGVPFLFFAGVVFAYFLVLPPAISFLQNFNDDSFDILLQARDFYSFSILVLIAMGALFQIPVGILAATRLGVVTPRQLRKGRRYAIVIIAIVAALLPGQDPVTMLILMAPLVVLYEGSILFASLLDRRAARARAREEAEEAAADDDELHPDRDLKRPMLFDLRGRGRRRTVKIVYITLALLMGGGLVLFGIGGGGAMQGGLVDAITGSSGGDTGSERFDKAREGRRRGDAAQRRRTPRPGPRWRAPGCRAPASATTSTRAAASYTEAGKAKLAAAADAWEQYLALEPKNPDDRVAGLMVRAFDQTGLNRPADAAAAQEIITEARPSATTYATLAIYAYQAGQTRKGDLARNEALELAARGRAQHAQGSARPGQAAGGRRSSSSRARAPRPRRRRHAQAQVGPGRGLHHWHPRPCSSTGRAADS